MDISSMLEVQMNEVKEIDSKENVTPLEFLPSMTNVPVSISQEEYNVYKLMFGNDVPSVRFQRLHCTACDVHIGSAPSDSHNMFEHPVLHTLLCSKCRDFYGDGTFEQGDDATDMFCRWCANGGNLYCCSFCSNTFCSKCIRRNFDPVLRKKIEADEKWKCFVCDPTDVYLLRGTCWALLQYIQSVNKSLQNNCKLTQQEIDEKMNTDEANCCPRRKKRKRCKTGSNSEEDDATYKPIHMGQYVQQPKKRSRGRPKLNGSSGSISKKILGRMSVDNYVDSNEILPSLLSCEQTMVECENATVSEDGRIISQSEANSVLHRVHRVGIQQPLMYNTSVINVVANPNYIPSTSTLVPRRHIPASPNHSKQTKQFNLYQTLRPVPAPMVTIPYQKVGVPIQPRFSKRDSQRSLRTVSPSVIEIESDSEDVTVVRATQPTRSSGQADCSKNAVPVALVSSKNNYDNVRRQEFEARRNAKTLNQRLLPHGKDIDHILVNLRKRFQGLFEVSKREELKKHKLNDARRLIKQLHRKIRGTVTQLACINDRIVREYNKWKRYQLTVGYGQRSIIKRGNCEDIPLEMICTNESGTDSDADSEIEYGIMSPSDLVGTTNAVDGIRFFKAKDTVDRAVGNDSALLVDKSVQIYDVELQDYDKCIRRSTLKVVNRQMENANNALKSSTKDTDKESRNYEEHFIQFLQSKSIEVEGTEEDDSMELPDPNETSLKDLIEANSPFVSELLETMDRSATPNRRNSIISIRKDSDLKLSAAQTTNSIACRKVEDLVKMNSDANNDINEKIISNKCKNGKVSHEESDMQRGHSPASDKISVANVLNDDEQSLSRANAADSEGSNEDDCTIIDD